MTDKIKKIKIKQANGNFGEYIPLGADAANVDLTDGSNVETAIDNIKTQLEEPIEYTEISNTPDLTIYAKTENLAKVATSGNYNELDNIPDLTIYTKTENLSKVAVSNDYNDLDNKPEVTNYELPIATQTTLGGVKIDGNSITINNGVISSHALALPTPPASSESTGVVKPDNITTKVMDDGTLYVNTAAVAPKASSTTLGVVQPDNSSITIDANGIISAIFSGGSSTGGLKIQTGIYSGTSSSGARQHKDIGIAPLFVIAYSPGDIPAKGPEAAVAFIMKDFIIMINYWGETVVLDGDSVETPNYNTNITRWNATYLDSTGFYIRVLNYTGNTYNYIAFYDPDTVDLGTPE